MQLKGILAQQLLSIKVRKKIALKNTVFCYYQGVLKRVIHSVELEMNEYKLNHFFSENYSSYIMKVSTRRIVSRPMVVLTDV